MKKKVNIYKVKILKKPDPVVESEGDYSPLMLATKARMEGGELWFKIGWMICKLTIKNMEKG